MVNGGGGGMGCLRTITLSMKGLLLGCPLGVLKMSISMPFTTLHTDENTGMGGER